MRGSDFKRAEAEMEAAMEEALSPQVWWLIPGAEWQETRECG